MQDDDTSTGSEEDAPPESGVTFDGTNANEAAFEDGDNAVDEAALGQSEIDDLFGISMDEAPPNEGIHALLSGQYVRHRRLPVLEACFDRLVQSLSKSFRSLTSGDLELSLVDSSSVRFGSYIEEVPLPALISVFKVAEWNDYGLINVDSTLIYAIIDVMLGGRRAASPAAIEMRSFTAIETKLIERMILLILEEMTEAFKELTKVTFQLERMESNPSLVDIASPSNVAFLFAIDVNMGDRGGRIEILIPYATLEPMRDLLEQMYTGEKFGHDSLWESHLTGQMLQTDVELEVIFGEQMMPLGLMLSLEVGSTVILRKKPQDLVTLRCGNASLMNAQVGRIGDNIAVQVADWCNGAGRALSMIDCRPG